MPSSDGAGASTNTGPPWPRRYTPSSTRQQYLLYGLLCGYGFAWIGHFGFEKNKPARFKRALYRFMGDWVMYKDISSSKIPF